MTDTSHYKINDTDAISETTSSEIVVTSDHLHVNKIIGKANTNDSIILDLSGNVGVGTAPGSQGNFKLDIDGSMNCKDLYRDGILFTGGSTFTGDVDGNLNASLGDFTVTGDLNIGGNNTTATGYTYSREITDSTDNDELKFRYIKIENMGQSMESSSETFKSAGFSLNKIQCWVKNSAGTYTNVTDVAHKYYDTSLYSKDGLRGFNYLDSDLATSSTINANSGAPFFHEETEAKTSLEFLFDDSVFNQTLKIYCNIEHKNHYFLVDLGSEYSYIELDSVVINSYSNNDNMANLEQVSVQILDQNKNVISTSPTTTTTHTTMGTGTPGTYPAESSPLGTGSDSYKFNGPAASGEDTSILGTYKEFNTYDISNTNLSPNSFTAAEGTYTVTSSNAAYKYHNQVNIFNIGETDYSIPMSNGAVDENNQSGSSSTHIYWWNSDDDGHDYASIVFPSSTSITFNENFDYVELLVAGGGGGGGNAGENSDYQRQGGGGAGSINKYTTTNYPNLTITKDTTYTATVGSGGTAGNNGSNSYISIGGTDYYQYGGGRGARRSGDTKESGSSGGSGGGAAYWRNSDPMQAVQRGEAGNGDNVYHGGGNSYTATHGNWYGYTTRGGGGGGAGGVGYWTAGGESYGGSGIQYSYLTQNNTVSFCAGGSGHNASRNAYYRSSFSATTGVGAGNGGSANGSGTQGVIIMKIRLTSNLPVNAVGIQAISNNINNPWYTDDIYNTSSGDNTDATKSLGLLDPTTSTTVNSTGEYMYVKLPSPIKAKYINIYSTDTFLPRDVTIFAGNEDTVFTKLKSLTDIDSAFDLQSGYTHTETQLLSQTYYDTTKLYIADISDNDTLYYYYGIQINAKQASSGSTYTSITEFLPWMYGINGYQGSINDTNIRYFGGNTSGYVDTTTYVNSPGIAIHEPIHVVNTDKFMYTLELDSSGSLTKTDYTGITYNYLRVLRAGINSYNSDAPGTIALDTLQVWVDNGSGTTNDITTSEIDSIKWYDGGGILTSSTATSDYGALTDLDDTISSSTSPVTYDISELFSTTSSAANSSYTSSTISYTSYTFKSTAAVAYGTTVTGDFTLTKDVTADILIVAGGGSGGTSYYNSMAGGGGAGGMIVEENISMPAGTYSYSVGRGGGEEGVELGRRGCGEESHVDLPRRLLIDSIWWRKGSVEY